MLLRRLLAGLLPARPRPACRLARPNIARASSFSTTSSWRKPAEPAEPARSRPLFRKVSGPKKPQPPLSIFQELFPAPPARHSRPDDRPRSSAAQALDPAPIAGQLHLSAEFGQWLGDVQQRADEQPSRSSHGGPTVLVLSGASPSLLEGDFYRLAPQGRHVDGWAAGGMLKVLQSRDPTTNEPQGQYFLFFSSRPAAAAYLDEVKDLHRLSRRTRLEENWRLMQDLALPAQFVPPPPNSPGAAAADLNAAVRRYTLLPPSSVLNLVLREPTRVLGPDRMTDIGHGSLDRQRKRRLDAEDPAGSAPQDHKVLLSLVGSRMTLGALCAAVDGDGEARNLAWRLWDPETSIAPLGAAAAGRHADGPDGSAKAASSAPGGRESRDGATQRFDRFVVAFAEPLEARRFARSWHKRELLDEQTDRTITINASAMW